MVSLPQVEPIDGSGVGVHGTLHESGNVPVVEEIPISRSVMREPMRIRSPLG